MRLLPAMIMGFVLLAAPVHSAAPTSEAEISAQLQTVTKENERLEAELNAAKSKPSGSIKAEVRGMMMKDNTGYYILTRMIRGAELRVWVNTFNRGSSYDVLVGKDVVANGQLLQNQVGLNLPTGGSSPMPQQGLYLVNQTIHEAAYVVEIFPPTVPTVPPPTPLPANPK